MKYLVGKLVFSAIHDGGGVGGSTFIYQDYTVYAYIYYIHIYSIYMYNCTYTESLSGPSETKYCTMGLLLGSAPPFLYIPPPRPHTRLHVVPIQ